MLKFFVETYGCQMNVSDSELITTMLLNAGLEAAHNIDEADVILFNTCSVRQHAEDRVLGRISNEQGKKMQNPNLKIGVLGCMAQRLGDDLMKQYPYIDFVVGVDQYHQLPALILGENHLTLNDFDTNQLYSQVYPSRNEGLSAFVTIMRGCDNFCSYCIVPHVRGRERSRAMDEILKEVADAGERGFKDITLLGQNVNSYHWQDVRFPTLLKEVAQISSIERVRFVTSHPKDLSDGLIDIMATEKRVCEHIHLPMQSGNSDVLAAMNRGYTAAHYEDLIHRLRAAIPNIAITTDIIAGFPGETESQFRDTCSMVERVEFDFAFCFKYSPREGTKAANFTMQLPEETRLRRLQELIEVQRKSTYHRFKAQVGLVKQVYVEGISRKSELDVSGKTRDFKITVFPGTTDLIGKFVDVKIVGATAGTLIGELVE